MWWVKYFYVQPLVDFQEQVIYFHVFVILVFHFTVKKPDPPETFIQLHNIIKLKLNYAAYNFFY